MGTLGFFRPWTGHRIESSKMLRTILSSLGFAGFLACSSTSAPSPPLELRGETGTLLLRIDSLEATSQIRAAPNLLLLMEDPTLDLALRSRAAGALAAFGFPIGIDFCLGIFTAGLEGFQERDKKLSIPFTDRMAFSRELAARSLAKVLQKLGKEAPFFSANFGAPDLRRAEKEWRKLLGPALSRLHSQGEWRSISPPPPSQISPRRWKEALARLRWKQDENL